MNFTHTGERPGKGFVALTPNFPMAKVVPVDLSSPAVNGVLIAQQGAFMASVGDVNIGISLDCNLLRCCCAGTGLVRRKYMQEAIVRDSARLAHSNTNSLGLRSAKRLKDAAWH
jgi:uncharacterized protein (AIM24 family)